MKEITLKIEYVDHETVVLHHPKGHTFTFSPNTRNGEELSDFLSN